jgi:hypothetical protein
MARCVDCPAAASGVQLLSWFHANRCTGVSRFGVICQEVELIPGC